MKAPPAVTMTKEQFKEIRESLNETQSNFATRLGYTSHITIAFKESGFRKITAQDEMIIRAYIHTGGIKEPNA